MRFRFKSDEWGDLFVLHIRKTDVYVIFQRGISNPNQFRKSKENGQTGQDLLQQAVSENHAYRENAVSLPNLAKS